MYYMVFNSAIVSVATGLLKLDNPRVVYVFIAGIFLFGVLHVAYRRPSCC
jgi:hypothetical protein